MTLLSPPTLTVSLVLAFVLRVVWALVIPVEPVSDAAAYAAFATNIAEHGVYGFTPQTPGAFWAVGTAGIYAGVYLLFGVGSALGVVVINLISALVVVWLLHDLGRRWFGETEGRIAALLFALWPMAIQFTTVLASEIHFMALTLAALACWDRAGRGAGGIAFLLFSGVFFAGATYVRPIALLIPAALAFAALLRAPRAAPGAILKAAVATALIFALVAPWSARNERLLGEPVFMSTNFWPVFWMGNHAETNGEFSRLPPETDGMTEVEQSDYMKDLSIAALRADPAGFVWRTTWKAVRLHERETIGVAWNLAAIERLAGSTGAFLLKGLSTLYWYAVLAFAVAGIFLHARREGAWTTLLSVPVWLWLYFTAVHAIIIIGDRYHMPAIPMIALLAAYAISRLAGLSTAQDQRRA
ncbi:glycosyltransferase family 39 protein [Palleronia sp. KMU-117]|uniref:glycosyltransferase family 39 protein n=1 Tax=Palleronia sp. KMU-117 TaxID=3434108 RepID=UPI003D73E5F3